MNSPRSSIRRNDILGRKESFRGHNVSHTDNISLDGRDDASSAEAMRLSRSSSVNSRHNFSDEKRSGGDISDDRSVSSSLSRLRLTKEQVQLEEARATSSASVASSYSRSSRNQKVSSSTSGASSSSKTSNTKLNGAPRTPSTYADEYLRAALATPSEKPYKRSASYTPFPSQATLTPSQYSYMSDVGRVYDDPPEITSIPTDEIVDSYTRPTIGEPMEKNEEAESSNTEGPEDEKEKVAPREAIVRGSRDEYTFGRLQARASKRRELLQQVPEEEDLTDYHFTARASRIKHIRSLYLPLEDVKEEKPSPVGRPSKLLTIANSIPSPTNQSKVLCPVPSPTNVARSPSNSSPASGSQASPTIDNAVSRKNDDSAAISSPTNRSVHSGKVPVSTPVPNSPRNQSVANESELSTVASSIEASPSSMNASTAHSFGRKTSLTSTNSDELSEYRAKLFAKMLHLLDDVEHPGLNSSSTKGSRRSHEYSVAELKLIQKRTEEEMSRILNEFDQSKRITPRSQENVLNTTVRTANLLKESNECHEFCYESEDGRGPPPPNVMTEAISSKLSDITSPTTYQDGSSVVLDFTSDKYICVAENEEEIAEGSPRNLPPRPASPRKKRMPVFPDVVGKEGLSIVQETSSMPIEKDGEPNAPQSSAARNDVAANVGDCERDNEIKAIASKNMGSTQANAELEKGLEASGNNSAYDADGDELNVNTEANALDVKTSIPTKETVSPRNQARDKLLIASRNAAKRAVTKEKKDAEDRFYSEIMNSVSAAEEKEVQRLNDEIDAFVATFDYEVDDHGVMNEDGSINNHVVSALLDECDENTGMQAQRSFPATRLHVPTHEQCGVGCVIQ